MPTLPSRIMNVRFVPTYPVSLAEGTGIDIATSAGTKTIGLNYAAVAATPGIADPATAQIVVYRQATGTYENARLDQLVFPAAGQRTGRGDADYTILTTDRVVALTASLTAPRSWTLPAAANVAGGTAVDVIDEAGGIGSTNTLTITRSASDTINGATTAVLSIARSGVRLISDGISKWTINLIGTTQIADGILSADTAGRAKMADGFLSADTTGRAKMADKFVTFAKQQDIATARVLGRTTAGSGAIEELDSTALKTVVGTASDTATGVIEIATAAEMKTGTSTTLAVVPGRLVNHPLIPKVLVYITNGGSVTNVYSYGVSTVSRIGAGFVTVNFSTNFSNTSYVVTGAVAGSAQRSFGVTTKAVGSVTIGIRDTVSGADTDSDFTLAIYGDQ